MGGGRGWGNETKGMEMIEGGAGLKDRIFHREGGGGERGQHGTPKFVILFFVTLGS